MSRRTMALLLGSLVVAAMLWGPQLLDGTDSTSQSSGSSTSAGTDPASGLRFVSLSSLPPEAGQTLSLIDSGGPFRHDQDGAVFQNREQILPQQEYGYYHEYTVETPGSGDRGARRIVAGSEGEYYWTGDHYQSFERIRR